MINDRDPIAALATPPGRAGVAVIRLSAPRVQAFSEAMLGRLLKPRYAHYGPILGDQGHILDQGLALYFPAPHSFTGEDVLELHSHGSPITIDLILKRLYALGARAAEPGEFSLRAYLNNKIDLSQAEALSDLINANTEAAARAALNSLQGVFSRQIADLQESLIKLRLHLEAGLDFAEEDGLDTGFAVMAALPPILSTLDQLEQAASRGQVLQEGLKVVLIGRPNAGKSSVMNRLAQQDLAIVTDIPGTTRDLIVSQIKLGDLFIELTDTAGLRITHDRIEREGINRALQALSLADHIFLVVDNTETAQGSPQALFPEWAEHWPETAHLTLLFNKIDLSNEAASLKQYDGFTQIKVSAKADLGFDLLVQHMEQLVLKPSPEHSNFSARRRHLSALKRARIHLETAYEGLTKRLGQELVAEDLRLAQQALSEITGQFTSDDLLGRIFSEFCIGK